MKAEIHPTYHPQAKVVCQGCNTAYTMGSTAENLTVELCANCHPFYTGKQKLVDTAGRVDRFRARQAKAATKDAPKKAEEPAATAEAAPEADKVETDTPEARLAEMKKNLESDSDESDK